MIWIILAALGVPIWLVVSALLAGLWSRTVFKRAPGVFPAKVRVLSGAKPRDSWPWPRVYARWVHDVLLIHQGLALVRNRALAVDSVSPSTLGGTGIKGLEDDPTVIEVHLDDGQVVAVATRADDHSLAMGPFAATTAPV